MSDFDINAHLRQQRFGQGDGSGGGGAAAGPSDGTNEKDTVTAALETNRMPMQLTKSLLGVNMENLGSTSITAGMDTEGVSGKNIPSLMSSVENQRPGFLYTLLHSIFIKNREITDHTQYLAGNYATDGASGGGDSGTANNTGTSSQGFESQATSSGMGEMFIAAGGGNHFEVRSVSMAELGNLSPPVFGGAATSRGEGFGVA